MKATNIEIDARLWKEIEEYTKRRGTSVSKFVEQFLAIFLSPQLERGVPSFSTARSDFFWEDGLIDFNTGALGSHPTRVVGKVMGYLYELGKYGPSSQKMSERLEKEEATCRRNLASALGAGADEILYETNTTKSLRLAYDIIEALTELPSTDNMLTTDAEHNSIKRLLTIHSRLKIKKLPLLSLFSKGCDKEEIVELFSSAIDPHTRLLLTSHIPYVGGIMPVGEIIEVAKENNPDMFCIIDGAHTMGLMPLNVKRMNCDFYGVGFHKFCLGVPAFGSLYADFRYLEKLNSSSERLPIFDSYGVSKTFRTDEELGTINGIAIAAFNEAFNLLFNYYKIGRIEQRIKSLAEHFLELLHKNDRITMVSPSAPGLISGVISISIKGVHSYDEYKKLAEQLENKYKILCKALRSPPCLRICLHYFISEDDIDRFFEALSRIV